MATTDTGRALAIETSGRLGSVAILENHQIVAEDEFAHGLQHAAEMIPRIDRMCRAQDWTPTDLREIYVSAGPGSFTGLRIGITLAKTLAFATGARIVAVPSVQVLARNSPAEAQQLIIVLDAKRGQIFTSRLVRENGQWVEAEPARLDSLQAMLQRSPRPVFLLGEGIPFHRQFIPADDSSIIVCPEPTWRARAAAVAEIGAKMAAQGRWTEPDLLVPIYIRKPEAQEKWEQAHPSEISR